MKYYLIDPHTRTISECAIDDPDELALRVIIGDGCRKTYLWGGVKKPDGLHCKDSLYTHYDIVGQPVIFFKIGGIVCGWSGRAVILGHTEDGEPCSPETPIDVVRQLFTFF